MDLAEPTEGQEYECPQRPITSSPFRSPAPPLLTTFEGVLSTVSAASAAADFAVPVPDNLDNLRSEKHLAENAETASSASSASASTGEQSGGSTEDHEESGSSTSSSKRSRARRRKKAHYAKIRDQVTDGWITMSFWWRNISALLLNFHNQLNFVFAYQPIDCLLL